MEKFICVRCGNVSEYGSYRSIISNKKVCFDCKTKERIKKQEERNEKNKKAFKEKSNNGNVKKIDCEWCGISFEEKETSKAKFCSSSCRGKSMEHKKFHSGLQKANKALFLSNVAVYGIGKAQYTREVTK